MRLNAHLLQSVGNAGDIGKGNDANYSSISSTSKDYYVRAGTRSVNVDTITPILGTEFRFRKVFTNQVFCTKFDGGTYNYLRFFDSSDGSVKVAPHELMTAGQMADYITNTSNGVMPTWVGDHLGDSDSFYDFWISENAGTGKPNVDWKDYSLSKKLTDMFKTLFFDQGNVHGNSYTHFNLYASYIKTGVLEANSISGSIESDTSTFKEMLVGASDAGSDHILQVTGGANGTREIILQSSNNTTLGSGIHGAFKSGETKGDYGSLTGKSFIDVDRYYLRDSDGRHNIPSIGMTYINASSSGVQVNFNANGVINKLILPKPASGDCTLLTNKPSSNQNVFSYNGSTGYDFIIRTINNSTGLGVQYNTAVWKFCINSGKLKITNPGSDVYLNYRTATNSGSNYHILTSEANETMYGAYSSNITPYITFSNSSNYNTLIGSHGDGSNNSYFCIKQRNGGQDLSCDIPLLSANSSIIVTNPSTPQTINSSLLINGGSQTLTINPNDSGVVKLSPNTGKTINVYSDTEASVSRSDTDYVKSNSSGVTIHSDANNISMSIGDGTVTTSSSYILSSKKKTIQPAKPTGADAKMSFYSFYEWDIFSAIAAPAVDGVYRIADHAYFDNYLSTNRYIHAQISVSKEGGMVNHVFNGGFFSSSPYKWMNTAWNVAGGEVSSTKSEYYWSFKIDGTGLIVQPGTDQFPAGYTGVWLIDIKLRAYIQPSL